MALNIVVLAAGQGSRMQSALPKVMHRLAGKTLLEHVISVALQLEPKNIYVVYGHGGEQVRDAHAHLSVSWVEQAQQLGTGHALLQALPQIGAEERVLVLYGDVPLLSLGTLQALIMGTEKNQLGLLTAIYDNPTGYGRIVRDRMNNIIAIIEHKDATIEQATIQEIYTGILLAPVDCLREWLMAISLQNAQQEYYLTDVVKMAADQGVAVTSAQPSSVMETQGINDRLQLATAERYYQEQQAYRLLKQGVTILDPKRIDVRGDVQIDQDTVLDVNVVLEGVVRIGKRCHIGPNVVLRHVSLGDDVEILANCVIEEAEIAPRCVIGPFTRVRPGTKLLAGVKLGNFVEVKKSVIGEGSKVNHLSYIGDATIGKKVNIGAGTITCNYDGYAKYETRIEDHVFIGSDTQLIAPVTIGEGAVIGAGSTINKNAPPNQLTLSRALQKTISAWKKPSER